MRAASSLAWRIIPRVKTLMPSTSLLALGAVLGATLPQTQARAGIVLDEATFGDFSDDRVAPTAVTLETGMNVIAGFSGQSLVPEIHDLD